MTDRKAIEAMLAKVEAGDVFDWRPYYEAKALGHRRLILLAFESFGGSLDAAKALHESVLPGWDWNLGTLADKEGICQAIVYETLFLDSVHSRSFAPCAARAWLIAILRALLAKED